MPYTSSLDPRNWKSWETDPSTRDSVHLLTKLYPVDATLSVAGTAQDLISVAPGLATVNLVTNPSMETADPPTGYTAVGSTLTRSATVANYGTYSLSINPDNAAAGEGAYYSIGIMPGHPDNERALPLSVSCYFQDNVDSGDDARIRVYGVTSASFLADGNTITLSSSWQRSSVSFMLHTNEEIRIYLVNVTQHNTTFFADGLQVEVLPEVTDYCDGSIGYYNFWDGTAHASTSRRWRQLSQIRMWTLHTTRDAYVNFDAIASNDSTVSAQTRGRFVRAGTDWWLDHPVYLDSRVSWINRLSGEQPRIWGEIWGI